MNGIGAGGGSGGSRDIFKEFQARAKEISAGSKLAKQSLTSSRPDAGSEAAGSFGEALTQGLNAVESKIDTTNNIQIDVLEGRLDVHEVAAKLKESEITFQFALQVRNKLMDAYREVMRMSV